MKLHHFISYVGNTHMHSDHTVAAERLKKRLPACKTVISAATGASADILVRHGDILQFGRHKLEVRATPGHTHGNYNGSSISLKGSA